MATDSDLASRAATAFHVAVFCKAPISGRVKSRLIPTLGAAQATAVYHQLVQRTLDTIQSTRQEFQASASLWVADDLAHPDIRAWASGFDLPLYLQRGDDLGARMLHCMLSLHRHHQKVLLIGTDCPILQPRDVHSAAAALGADQPWVFTPAEDGGYVLAGSCAPAATAFTGIAWSTDAVMTQTRSALAAAGLRWGEMPTLWDVDEPADVDRAAALDLLRCRAPGH